MFNVSLLKIPPIDIYLFNIVLSVLGSGKTAAFLVPILNQVYEMGPVDLPTTVCIL